MFTIVLPSKNESDSISDIVSKIDNGLTNDGLHTEAIIINSDNSDDDSTKNAFNNTNTHTEKIYKHTGGIGKGDNIINGFKISQNFNADFCLLLDSDLTSFEYSWLSKIKNKLEKNYDLVTPIYSRYWIEGNTTNHLCMPVIYAVTGKLIEQPIAGDFGISKKLYNRILQEPLDENFQKYGIDILISSIASKEKYIISQIELTQKIHKPSFNKTEEIFEQVAATLFKKFNNQNVLNTNKKVNEITLHPFISCNHISDDDINNRENKALELMKKYNFMFGDYKKVDSITWANILSEALYEVWRGNDKNKVVKSLLAYFLLRTVDYLRQVDAIKAKAVVEEQTITLRELLLNQN